MEQEEAKWMLQDEARDYCEMPGTVWALRQALAHGGVPAIVEQAYQAGLRRGLALGQTEEW